MGIINIDTHLPNTPLIYSILNQTSELSDYFSSESSATDSEDNEIQQLDYSSEEEEEEKDCHCINTLTEDTDLFFDLLGHLEDNELKKKYLLQYKNNLIKEQTSSSPYNSAPPKIKEKLLTIQDMYTLKDVMEQASISSYNKPVTIPLLKQEINELKSEVIDLKRRLSFLEIVSVPVSEQPSEENQDTQIGKLQKIPSEETSSQSQSEFLKILHLKTIYSTQKYLLHVRIQVTRNAHKFLFDTIALLDSGADINTMREGIIPSKFWEKTSTILRAAEGSRMQINHKLSDVCIFSKEHNSICLPFVLAPQITEYVILGTPFCTQMLPFYCDGKTFSNKERKLTFELATKQEPHSLNQVLEESLRENIKLKTNQICFLQEEIKIRLIEHQLQLPDIQLRIEEIKKKIVAQICSDLPNAFWHRKKYEVELPYEKDFDEKDIPTKARASQMNAEMEEYCKKEIEEMMKKDLIRKSHSPWSCAGFYVNKNSEIERGSPRLVINYKPLNKVLKWIRYPLPNKKDLLNKTINAQIYSKFDLKSGYNQIQVAEKDRYKTAFTLPFGQYEWNVMPFGLKNAPSEFQNIMNEIFTPYNFIIVYLDDILIFSDTLEQHFKHLNSFLNTALHNGIAISQRKMELFQTRIRFLGYILDQGQITPIQRSIEFASKFPDELKEKSQLQRFLGSLNYVHDYYQNLAQDCKLLYQRLQKNPSPWTEEHTKVVRKIKEKVQTLPLLHLCNFTWQKIVETDASDFGYGGILKQVNPHTKKEELVRFTSGIWKNAQVNYAPVRKEILSIVLCVTKFQDDLLNQKFKIRVDCSAAKQVLNNDVQNKASKQLFARWQAILSVFDYEIEYIKGSLNSLPDFLTREFLTGSRGAPS